MRAETSLFAAIVIFCALALGSGVARGVDVVELSVDAIAGEGLRAEGLRLVLRPGAQSHGLELHARELHLGEALSLHDVRVQCAALTLRGMGGDCTGGTFEFEHPWLGEQALAVRFSYAHPDRLDLQTEDLVIGGTPVRVGLSLQEGRWALQAQGRDMDLATLADLSARFGQAWPMDVSGTAHVAVSAQGRGGQAEHLDLGLTLGGIGFSSEDGLQAGEALEGVVNVAIAFADEPVDGGLRLDLKGRWTGGGVYLHPVFVEAEVPADTVIQARWLAAERVLDVERFQLDQPGVISLAGSAVWAVDQGLSGVEARVNLDRVDLPAAYETYAQPFLPGTSLDSLTTAGILAGRLVIREGTPQEWVLNASRVVAQDRAGRFSLEGLDAALHWDEAGTAPVSRVSMDGGHIYGIDLGATRFQPVIGRDGFHLPSPVHLPILDGALEIRDLRVSGLGSGDISWAFDGGLTPISMEGLTAALGWPELAGTLAGIIPDVRYEQGVLSVGGRLLVRAFDGDITLGDLRLRDPLGVAPELSAQIRVRGLDLARMTQTFDVGRITGRLDGDVRDLVLVRWSPVQFDAVLRTPPGDTSTRRISQRAVDSLTRVGGGVGGALSGGFLRIFEDFGYRQLGLSCRLVGEVCHMDGVAPAEQGYYIVQGSGLPQINVIGYTRQVAWRDLVTRLAAVVLEGGAPVLR